MRQLPNLVGQRFGMLTVVEQAASGKDGKRRWICRCDCGKETTVLGQNLTRGGTVSCGCKKRNDLTGQRIGRLTVLEQSDQYGTRGSRKQRLWKCRCDCGQLTYKATDSLTNPDISMCKDCAGKYGAEKAREKAGFTGGTQLAKIRVESDKSDNLSGVRGVYYDGKRGKYRARIKFKRKIYNLGYFTNLEDAIKARKRAEEDYFGKFLEDNAAAIEE